jgi:lipoic acid synthetase
MNKTFVKKRINISDTTELKKQLRARGINTVCESALCPNIGECFAKKTATFLICGNICTRGCSFCGVTAGRPLPLDPSEPERISEAVKKFCIRYAVITSVTRDDLSDGGASHFVNTVNAVRAGNAGVRVEILVPDFKGNTEPAKTVFGCKPDVFAHNIETVPAFYSKVRHNADYKRSLALLESASKHGLVTKSGLMLGLGETEQEIAGVMKDLVSVNCKILTIGQYLAPSKSHYPVQRFIDDGEFIRLKESALSLGFSACAAGSYVRSSYNAQDMAAEFKTKLAN